MPKTKEQLHADWCAARGVSEEAERVAREAYEAAVKADATAAAPMTQDAPGNTHAVTTQKATRKK